MAGNKKTSVIETVIVMNGENAKQVIAAVKNELEELKKQAEQLRLTDPNSKELTELQKQMENLNNAVRQSATQMDKINKVYDNLGGSTLRQLKSALSACKQEMLKMSSENTQGVENLRKKYAAIQEQIKKLSLEAPKNAQSMSDGVTKAVNGIARKIIVYAGFNELESSIKKIYNGALEMSDQLANIRKVSGLAMSEIDELNLDLGKIDTRSSIHELNELAYAGAKLGMGTYGKKGLESYVEAANEINSALKEDMGVEAMTALSKIGEVMGLFTDKNNIGKPLKDMGSAIFTLASTSTATGKHIVDFSARLTGMAKSAHITTDELLGLASASDAMYLMPEVSSTAFSKFIVALQTRYNTIEKKLKMKPDTLKNLIQQGKTMEAIVATMEGMKKKGNLNAMNDVFKDLGSDGARMKNVFTTMAQNVDMLKEHLQTSKTAFIEGTAVTKEYNIQNETANAILLRANNMWEKAFINPESIDVVKSLVQVWYDLSKALTSSMMVMGPIKVVFNAIVFILKGLIQLLPMLIGVMGTFIAQNNILPFLEKVRTGLKGWATHVRNAYNEQIKAIQNGTPIKNRAIAQEERETAAKRQNTTATQQNTIEEQKNAGATAMAGNASEQTAVKVGYLRKAVIALRVTMKSLMMSIGIGILFEAVSWIASLLSKTEETRQEVEKLDTSLSKVTGQAGASARELESLVEAINKAPKGSKEKEGLMAKMNRMYGTFITNLRLETSEILKQGNAYDKLTRAIRGKVYSEMQNEDYNKFVKPYLSKELTYLAKFEEQVRESGDGKYYHFDNGWLANKVNDLIKSEGGKGASVNTIMEGLRIAFNKSPNKEGLLALAKPYVQTHIKSILAEQGVQKKYNTPEVNEDILTYNQAQISPEQQLNPAVDKEAIKEQQQVQQKQRKAVKQATRDSDAVIAKIQDYYSRQRKVIENSFNEGYMDAAQQEEYLFQMKQKENAALASARRAISSGNSHEWDIYKKTQMGEGIDMFDTGSYFLLQDIRQANTENIHDRFAKNKGQSELDAIGKNAAKNLEAIEKNISERQKKVAAELTQYDYTKQVDINTEKQLVNMGLIAPDMSKALNTYIDLKPTAQSGTEAIVTPGPVDEMLATARANEMSIYGMDMRQPTDRSDFMKMMFANKKYTSYLNDIASLDPYNDDDAKTITLFYQKMVDYLDAYTEGKKKETERDRKIYSYKYQGTETYEQNKQQEKDLEGEQKAASISSSLGFTTEYYAKDTELEMLKLKLKAAQDYYSFLQQAGADQMLLQEQQQKINEAGMNLYEKMMERTQMRLSNLKQWMSPVEKAGEEMGKAVFGSLEDRKNVFKNLIQSYAELTKKMILNWVKQRIQQKMHNRIMETAEEQHESSLTMINETGGTSRIMTEETTNATLETKQTEHAGKSISTEAAETSGKVQLGIVGAIAKTLSELGWWGIPLVAVITALLNALLSAAMSAVSKLFGGGASSKTVNTTKITSGMLTYDEGNVQSFAANDGNTYQATPVAQLSTSLVTSPIATSVNGLPSLVAERGPEIVIGRETTKAMMMNDPALVRTIVNYDRYHSGRVRALDSGEIPLTDTAINMGTNNPNGDLATAVNTLNSILSKGISARINKYGAGGLIDEVADGLYFAKRNKFNKNVTRLFG